MEIFGDLVKCSIVQWSSENENLIEEASRDSEMRKIETVSINEFQSFPKKQSREIGQYLEEDVKSRQVLMFE